MFRSSVVSEADIEAITLKAQAKSAFEESRVLSLKGWLFVILPMVLVLVMLMAYGVQEATGVQLYSLLNQPIGTDGKPINVEGVGGRRTLVARLLLGILAVSAGVFLWEMWKRQGGAAGFAVGGRIGRSAAFQADKRALARAEQDAVVQHALLQGAEATERASALARNQQIGAIAAGIAAQNGVASAAGPNQQVAATVQGFNQPPQQPQQPQYAPQQPQQPQYAPQQPQQPQAQFAVPGAQGGSSDAYDYTNPVGMPTAA